MVLYVHEVFGPFEIVSYSINQLIFIATNNTKKYKNIWANNIKKGYCLQQGGKSMDVEKLRFFWNTLTCTWAHIYWSWPRTCAPVCRTGSTDFPRPSTLLRTLLRRKCINVAMAHILDGNSEHVAHAWRTTVISENKYPIYDCSRSNQMPYTDHITKVAICVRTPSWVTI